MSEKQIRVKGWQPIEEYFNGEYDWVLIKYYDKDCECVPNVAEFNKSDNKWHLGDSNYSILPEIFKIKYFFNMQQLDMMEN